MKKSHLIKAICIASIATLAACSSDDSTNFSDKIIPNDIEKPLITPKAFYIANEDWFGHSNGSINAINLPNYSIRYRIYEPSNKAEKIGVTLQYATAYAEHYFAVSKKENNLVMLDKDFKFQSALSAIDGGSHAHAFVGINANKAYVSTTSGISVISIQNNILSVVGKLDGTSSDIGSMVYKNGYVYAATTREGLLIIDAKTDQIVANSPLAAHQITIDKNGDIWIGTANELRKIDTALQVSEQLQKMEIFDITGALIASSAGGWNAGSLCASSHSNTLYWISGKNIASFDTTQASLNPEFYKLGNDAHGNTLAFYGAGVRVNPVTDELVLTYTRDGWGENFTYNWVGVVSKTGEMVKETRLTGGEQIEQNHYWFPAVPFFEDNNAPQILLNQIFVNRNEVKQVDLLERRLILDQDTPMGQIDVSIKNDGELAHITYEKGLLTISPKAKSGTQKITISAISNGKTVEKTIQLVVL